MDARLNRFGLTVFLFAEGMLFAGVVGGFIVLRAGAAVWAAPGLRDAVLALSGRLAAAPLLLVVGSAGLLFDPRGRRAVVRALAAGLFFLGLLAWAWARLRGEGIWFGTGGLFTSTFFALTGLHGLHVAASLGFLGRAVPEGRKAGRPAAALFWHFGTVCGIAAYALLFGTLYLAK